MPYRYDQYRPESLKYLPRYSHIALSAYRPKNESGIRISEEDWRQQIRDNGGQPFEAGATQGFVAPLIHDDRDPSVVVAFRGTETDSLDDYVTDISTKMIKPFGCQLGVHSGAYKSVVEALPQIYDLLQPYRSTEVDFIGHSLGGMQANIAAFHLLGEGWELGRLVTFGAPATGNQSFASTLCAVFGRRLVRVVRCGDVFPRLWNLWIKGYRHSNGLLYIDRNLRAWRNYPKGWYSWFDRQMARIGEHNLTRLGLTHHSMQAYHDILVSKYSLINVSQEME